MSPAAGCDRRPCLRAADQLDGLLRARPRPNVSIGDCLLLEVGGPSVIPHWIKSAARLLVCSLGLSHSGLTSRQAHSTSPRQARNSPSTIPSSKCRSGSAATRQRSAACRSSSTVSAPTIARSLLARLTRRPGDTSVSGQGCPSAPSQPRMRLRMPSREFRSGRGVSSLMGSTTVYEEKVSDSFMASASVAVLNSATAKRWRTVRVANRDAEK